MNYSVLRNTLLSAAVLSVAIFTPNTLASDSTDAQETAQCQQIAALTPREISSIHPVSQKILNLSKNCLKKRKCEGDVKTKNTCIKNLTLNTFLLEMAHQTGKKAPVPYLIPNTRNDQATPSMNTGLNTDISTNSRSGAEQNDDPQQNESTNKPSNQSQINWF